MMLVVMAASMAGCTEISSSSEAFPAASTRDATAGSTPDITDQPAATNLPVSPTPMETAPLTGYLAPDFSGYTLDGESIQLSDLRGKRVLLNFWATWCAPCRLEMPDLQSAYERFGGDEFVVVAVDVQEPRDRVARYVEEMGVTFPVVLDETGEILILYKVRGIPTTFLIDREGVIAGRQIGVITYRAIVEALELLP